MDHSKYRTINVLTVANSEIILAKLGVLFYSCCDLSLVADDNKKQIQ